MDIGVILGSTRPARISPSIGGWIASALNRDGLQATIIDLAQVDLPFLDEPGQPSDHRYQNAHTIAWSATVSSYDGFVLVSPQYNWGYPAPLKNALDTVYDEWRGKPVSVVTYGGHGGFQAALGLGLVMRGLRMRQLATNPQIVISADDVDERGAIIDVDRLLTPYRTAFEGIADEFLARS